MRIRCYSQLRDIDKGREYTIDYPKSIKAKTSLLPILRARGNLSPNYAQVIAEPRREICQKASDSPRNYIDQIINSKAIRHITPNYKAFIEYSIVKDQLIETANRTILLSAGLGKVQLSIRLKGYIRSIILIDILHIL